MKKYTRLILMALNALAKTPLNNEFTYQGELTFNNAPANGVNDPNTFSLNE